MDGTEERPPPALAHLRLDEVERRLTSVEGAFRRIGEGAYGSCESCRSPLGDELLTQDPTARWCSRCAATAPA